jgi:hypothetical protein
MARIFSTIRQKLIGEINIKNYLKYAIGEIILLVMGIFIALQINNWNSLRKDHQREIEYLNNIRRDLKEQILNIDAYINFESNQLGNAEDVLQALTNDSFLTDTLLNKLILLTERRTFVPDDPTFQDLKSTGNLNLIKNFNLRDNIIKYYQLLSLQVSIIGQNNDHFIDELFNQNMMKNSLVNFSSIGKFDTFFGLEVFKVPKKILSKTDDIVRSNMMNENNKVLVLNLLSNRYLISSLQKDLMGKLKSETEKLLELVSAEID